MTRVTDTPAQAKARALSEEFGRYLESEDAWAARVAVEVDSEGWLELPFFACLALDLGNRWRRNGGALAVLEISPGDGSRIFLGSRSDKYIDAAVGLREVSPPLEDGNTERTETFLGWFEYVGEGAREGHAMWLLRRVSAGADRD